MRHLFQSHGKISWEDWGIDATSFTVKYRIGYFRDDDWSRIIHERKEDTLIRCESESEVWEKWRHTFEGYPITGNHIFSLFGETRLGGFIYLFLGEESGHYKIGFTSDNDPYARRGSLQNGSSEILQPAGHFRAASINTESVVHTCFASKRIRGEWFALTEQDVANLLDEDWRMRHNIF